MSSSILLQFGVNTQQSLLQNNVAGDIVPNGSDPEIDMSVVPEEKKTYRHTSQSYSGYIGLPYQDHNYVAPRPPTPPASPPATTTKTVVNGHIDIEDVSCNTVVVTTPVAPAPPPEPSSVDDSVTRCICDFDHDDGYMICCDKCGVWQHVDCMGVDRSNIPDLYKCEGCEPRKVDKPRAIKIQAKKREFLLHDSSATETEDETPHGKSRKAAKNKRKENNKLNSRQKKFKKNRRDKDKDGRRKPINGHARKKLLAAKLEKERIKPTRKRKITENSNGPSPTTDSSSSKKDSSNSFMQADTNNVSGDLQKILATRKYNGQHSKPTRTLPDQELLERLFIVRPISDTNKVLKAAELIESDCAIAEFKGNVMLREQCDKDGDLLKRAHPYMLCYSKREGLDICIDASRYGNDARYVRRSCTPNAEVQDIIDNGEIHFYIYSLDDIKEEEEITIPFDFNYQDCSYSVECACSRPNCPVVRFHKMDSEEAMSDPVPSPPATRAKPLKKKRRATRSTEEKVEDLNGTGPGKKIVNVTPGPKRRRLTPLSPLKVNATGNKESLKSPEVEDEITSPVHALGSPKSELIPGAPQMTDEEREAEVERRKKMTREERKMEAIMKAFEKLEKREERRKEAIARIHGPGGSRDEDLIEEELPPLPPVKEFKPERVKMFNRKGKKKSRPTTPARRQSRTSSSISAADSSADENISITPTPSITTPSSTSETPSTASVSAPNSALPSERIFRFPKTKKHLMNEWLHERSLDLQKPLSIKTDAHEEQEPEAEFVRCVPSPHTNTLSHLRRNSVSACQAPRVSTPSQVQLDHSMGSAKKRWLRQAMNETTNPTIGSTSPVPLGSMSPNPNANSCSNSPGAASPVDFVTPLKKRRLARESVGMEGPYPLNPSTPTPSVADAGEVLSSAGTPPSSEEKPKLADGDRLINGFRPRATSLQAQRVTFEFSSSNSNTGQVQVKSEGDSYYTAPTCSETTITSVPEGTKSEPAQVAENQPAIFQEANPSFKEESPPLPVQRNVESTVVADNSTSHSLQPVIETEQIHDSVDTTDYRRSSVDEQSSLNVSQSSSSASSMFEDRPVVDTRPVSVDRTLPQSSSCVLESVVLENVLNAENARVGVNNLPEFADESGDTTITQTVDSSERANFILQPRAGTSAVVVDSSETLSSTGNVCDSTNTTFGASHQTDTTSSQVSCSSAMGDLDKEVTSESRSEFSQLPCTSEVERSTLDNDRTCCSTTSSVGALVIPGTSASSSTDERVMEVAQHEVPSSEGDRSSIVPPESVEADCGTGFSLPQSLPESAARPSSSIPANANQSVEEGELDSSFSEMGSPLKKAGTTSPLVDQTVSCSSDLPTGSEKEEGEITDEEPDRSLTPKAESSVSQMKQFGSGGSSEISSTNHRWSKYSQLCQDRASSSRAPVNQEDISPSQPSTSSHAVTGASTSNCSISSTATKNTPDKTSSPGRDSCVDSSSTPSESEHLLLERATSIHMENSVSSTASDFTEDLHSLRPAPSESPQASIDISPVAKSTSPSSSSSPVSAGASCGNSKKKVSLLEYRKRLKQKGVAKKSTSSPSSSGCTTPTQREATPSTLAPLPLFGQSTSPASAKGGRGESDEDDARWSTSATAAERMREQTPLSLTERLRKEFGLDASEEEDMRTGSPDTPPPPPPPASAPPPPPPGRPVRDNDEEEEDDEPPPPPPPGQPAYQVGIVTPHMGQVQLMAPPPMVRAPPPQGSIIVPQGLRPRLAGPRPPVVLGQQPARIIPQAPVRGPPGPMLTVQQTPVVHGQRMPSPRQRNSIPSLMSISLPVKSYNNSKADSSGTTTGHPQAVPTSSTQGPITQGYGQPTSYEGSSRQTPTSSTGYVQPAASTTGQAGYGQVAANSSQAGYGQAAPTPSHSYNHLAPTSAASYPSSAQGAPPRQYESYSTSSTTQPPNRNVAPTRFSNNFK